MEPMLMGAIAGGSLLAGLFFYRFWHHTRDQFFLYFAWSFWIEAVNRVGLALIPHADESEPVFYLVRLLSYALIIVAIWRKNRERR